MLTLWAPSTFPCTNKSLSLEATPECPFVGHGNEVSTRTSVSLRATISSVQTLDYALAKAKLSYKVLPQLYPMDWGKPKYALDDERLCDEWTGVLGEELCKCIRISKYL